MVINTNDTEANGTMTPEQQLRKQFERELIRLLPKGSYLLQPVETNAVGVPDYYLAYDASRLQQSTKDIVRVNGQPAMEQSSKRSSKQPRSLWIETKTTDYKVDKFQVNWHIRHTNLGCKTVILTLIDQSKTNILTGAQIPPNNTQQTPSRTALQPPQQAQPTQPIPQAQPKPRAIPQPVLFALLATSKMLDYPTLGRYIEKEQPILVALEDLLHNL